VLFFGVVQGTSSDEIKGWQLARQFDFISFSPISGCIPPGGNQLFTFIFDATQLEPNVISAIMALEHNGFGGATEIPITMIVSVSGVEGEQFKIQNSKFKIYPGYPNPFNPTTTIPFALPTEAKVKIEIYNLLGQRVAVLKDDIMQAGYHQTIWDGKSDSGLPIASGIYILKMEAKGTVVNTKFNGTSKLLLLK
jgi:hypothetical protein